MLNLQVSREDAGRLQALETEVEAAQKELVKLGSSTSQLQGQATALQKKIEGVGGPQMAKQRALIAKLQKVRGELPVPLQELGTWGFVFAFKRQRSLPSYSS